MVSETRIVRCVCACVYFWGWVEIESQILHILGKCLNIEPHRILFLSFVFFLFLLFSSAGVEGVEVEIPSFCNALASLGLPL